MLYLALAAFHSSSFSSSPLLYSDLWVAFYLWFTPPPPALFFVSLRPLRRFLSLYLSLLSFLCSSLVAGRGRCCKGNGDGLGTVAAVAAQEQPRFRQASRPRASPRPLLPPPLLPLRRVPPRVGVTRRRGRDSILHGGGCRRRRGCRAARRCGVFCSKDLVFGGWGWTNCLTRGYGIEQGT